MTCPHCHKPIPAKLLRIEGARSLSARRKIHGGGRPRSDAPRCPCGANTMARAGRRNWQCCKAAGVTLPPRSVRPGREG